jgi:Cytochrome domain of cellobiose dehydrogenase
MLNKVLVGVQVPASGPTASLYWTDHFGIPPPLAKTGANVTILPAHTWAKGGEWKATFLCSGCLSFVKDQPGFSGNGPAAFGFAYVSVDLSRIEPYSKLTF